MAPTNNQIARTEAHWSKFAEEAVEVKALGGAVYGFSSEIGCRRLADKMRAGRVGYSKNLNTWYFVNK